jgi:hypothetical protein
LTFLLARLWLESKRLCHLRERSHIRDRTPQKILCGTYQIRNHKSPTAAWAQPAMCPTCQREPRTATARSGGEKSLAPGGREAGRGRTRTQQRERGAGKQAGRRAPYGRAGPVVSVSYSAGHGRIGWGTGGMSALWGESHPRVGRWGREIHVRGTARVPLFRPLPAHQFPAGCTPVPQPACVVAVYCTVLPPACMQMQCSARLGSFSISR